MQRKIMAVALVVVMLLSMGNLAYAFGPGHFIPGEEFKEPDRFNPDNEHDHDGIRPNPDFNPKPDNPDPDDDNEDVNNALNFYINLAGDVLDTQEDSSHHNASLFTEALTDEYDVDGSDLLDAIYDSDYYTEFTYGYEGIAGEDEDDYENIDAEIRAILNDLIDFPSDAEILEEVKNQIEDGAKVYTINDELVSGTLISDEYYDVFWYSLKEGNSHWHVDGVLRIKDVPDVETFNVTYSWENAPTGVTLPTGATYAKDDTVTVDTTYYTGYEVPANNGKYAFSGWNRSDFTITEDTVIRGTWNFIPTGGLPPTQRAYNVTIKYLLDVDSTELQNPYTATYNQEVTVDVDGNVPATISFNNAVYDLDHITYGTWVSDRYGNYDHVSTAWYTLHDESDSTMYEVKYEWTVTGGGHGLPNDITPPVTVSLPEGTTVNVDTTFVKDQVVETEDDNEYVFSGWDKSGSFELTGDTVIHGTWTFRNCSEESGPSTPENPPTEYNYIINYVNKHGTILGTKTGKIGAGEDWFLYDLIPTTSEYGMLLNYSGSVEGENCQEDIIITACYYHMYGLEIKYVDVDSGNSFKLPYNDMYSECSDWDVSDKIPAEIGEYTLVTTEGDPVNGTDIHKNLIITAMYQKKSTPPQLFNWEVNYYDMHGNVIDAKRTGVNLEGGGWSLLNLIPSNHDILGTLDHYTGPVTGENCQADIVINAYYKANHSVSIYYIDADTNAEISTTYTDTKIDCDNWDYSDRVSNTLQANGNEYTFDSITGDPISGTDLHKDLSITVKYKMVVPTPTTTTKKYVYVTVKYVDEDGNQIHDDYTLKIRKNRSYDVNDQILSTIKFNNETYNFINTTGALLETNCCSNNVTITAHYVKEVHEEPIPDPEPIIPDPVIPDEPEPIIPDPVIPDEPEDNLDETPKTGNTVSILGSIVGLIGSSGGLIFLNRKKKEDEI